MGDSDEFGDCELSQEDLAQIGLSERQHRQADGHQSLDCSRKTKQRQGCIMKTARQISYTAPTPG